MQNTIKPRRTALYMPAANARALEKAQGLAADVLIFDLEDAVSPTDKTAARATLANALKNFTYGFREKVVRINSVESQWGLDDLKALQQMDADAVLIPKAESIEQVNEVLALLDKTMPVWLMIETPKGVLNIEALAAHHAVEVLVMGTNDLAKEMRVQQSASRLEFLHAFGCCVMAARAYGCEILDGVFNALDDAEGFKEVCLQGKQLGFDGKTVIHPKQLDEANKAFAPSDEEVAQAKAIIDAWNQQSDAGVLVVDGRLVEQLHVEQAEQILNKAESIAVQEV